MLHVATRKGLFTYEGEDVARSAFLGVPVTAVLPLKGGALLAAVGHGHFGVKLHRSDDGGVTWREIAGPKYPPKPPDVDDRCPMRGIPIPWNVELIWTMEQGGDGTLWVGTIPSGLFCSRDGAESWQLVRPLWDLPSRKKWVGGGYDYPGIHSIVVDPRDPRRVHVGISSGGVWLTEDGGETWAPRTKGMYSVYVPEAEKGLPEYQDPHRVVACPANPDVLWQQHHNGAFRSVDGGKSWTELHVAPSSFGFAVAAHPTDPQTAWYVPAIKDEQRIPVDGKVVVSRTRDGGKSFEILREGLPQRHAYDLIYRHGLDVSGRQLAMGSTTGSLWVSHDEGDSWRALSQHLPPVYQVRFG